MRDIRSVQRIVLRCIHVYVRARVCVCWCAFMCHRCRTSCEMGLAWRRPERCGAMPTGAPCLFTVHPNRQPNIYHHPDAAYILHFNLTFIMNKVKHSSLPNSAPVVVVVLYFTETVN